MEDEREIKKDSLVRVSSDALIKLQADVESIKTALLGNEYNPQGGLLFRTADLERQVLQLRSKYDKAIWTSGGAAIVIAVIANLVMWLFDVWKTIPIAK